MMKGLVFFCCACAILIFSMINLSIGPIVNRSITNYIVKMNTKTITLTSYSNLISKEEKSSNKDIFQDFSLISSINKKDNNKVFKFKFHKNENTNFKNMNLQDLLNTSSTFKGNDTKEKFKHTEESVSDLISKDYSNNNIIIKKRSLFNKSFLHLFNSSLIFDKFFLFIL